MEREREREYLSARWLATSDELTNTIVWFCLCVGDWRWWQWHTSCDTTSARSVYVMAWNFGTMNNIQISCVCCHRPSSNIILLRRLSTTLNNFIDYNTPPPAWFVYRKNPIINRQFFVQQQGKVSTSSLNERQRLGVNYATIPLPPGHETLLKFKSLHRLDFYYQSAPAKIRNSKWCGDEILVRGAWETCIKRHSSVLTMWRNKSILREIPGWIF